MKKHGLLALVLIGSLCLAFAGCGEDEKYKELESKISSLEEEVQSLSSTVEELSSRETNIASETTVSDATESTALPDFGFSSVEIGDSVTFGSYEQDNDLNNGKEPLEWEVLDIQNGKALIITKYVIDGQPFNDVRGKVTWEDSSLRQWLNDTFINEAFTEVEQTIIQDTYVVNDAGEIGVDAGNDTHDKVFCLSYWELLGYFESESRYSSRYSEDLIVPASAYASQSVKTRSFTEEDIDLIDNILYYSRDVIGSSGSYWWLRTPSMDGPSTKCYVDSKGAFGYFEEYTHNDADNIGVRPAMWIEVE